MAAAVVDTVVEDMVGSQEAVADMMTEEDINLVDLSPRGVTVVVVVVDLVAMERILTNKPNLRKRGNSSFHNFYVIKNSIRRALLSLKIIFVFVLVQYLY
uniref:Uncharacterized protein n=1 Tax=Photinus pyralis TaxID=7054 RepID=A0A1Y1K0A6_PHOPY